MEFSNFNRSVNPSIRTTLIASGIVVASLVTGVAHADTYSFAGVKNSGVSAADFAISNYNYTDEMFVSDTSLASAAGNGNLARAQTLPGVNRIEVSNSIPVTDEFIRQTGIGGPFAMSVSGWTENFMVTGGTGLGTALISVNVTGQFGNGYGAEGGYGMWLSTPAELQNEVVQFLSTDPITWVIETIDDPEDGGESLILSYLANVLAPPFTEPGLMLPPGSLFGGRLSTTINFTYGEQFSLASVLYGFANDTGSLSAMNSADFGITVLNNPLAQVQTDSGAVYAQAVPEAETWTMLLAGLGLVGFAATRRSKTAFN
jgi:hypothetical protein